MRETDADWPPLPRRPAAVIFDMDGTLLDTEAVHRTAMREAAGAMGLDFPDALFVRLVGIHREANSRTLIGHYGEAFAIDDFYRDADARFDAMWRDGVPLRPGAGETLDWLAGQGLPMAIATSTKSPFAEQRLADAGLAGHFAAIVTRCDVAQPKPDAEPYALAACRLGVAAADCVAVEDSPNGLRAAAAAGMMALLVPDLAPPDDDADVLAHAILPDLAAVRALIAAALRTAAGLSTRENPR